MKKQKMVIKVHLNCDKCRSKALKMAAAAKGVSSVSIEGADRDQLAVTGEGTDSVCLTKALRRKFGHASIVTVEEVKDKKDAEEKKEQFTIPLSCYYPPTMVHEYQYDSGCVIM
ncbi:heavy metal-associated isoprenylated plant protein 47-like [Abrus precatorius]|uniref:Heavy metal-associated isoprenylated plant protein 47-like n=1 Tax=Abrus precatorius TaxID=3816 RepID=A0A8B8MLY1_ABRPR|nr:heavy metal-associated isoprenylated plant protein 47-like [Abrus precatorius]